jgi:glycosyltransferase involved in cell wall biosynthesis
MHPRKNILRLLQAFELFKKQGSSLHKLVLAGNILWDDSDIKAILDGMTFRKDVVFPGRVSDADLKLLLGSAQALSFVPIFEGFGLPIVEAFQAGVPVICSNVTSMPEVAGDAALQVDPFNIQEIADAFQKLSSSQSLREELIAKGFIQKNKFTWQRTANLFYESMKTVF